MVYEWKDKVLLITGAARGIGSYIVRSALEEGARKALITGSLLALDLMRADKGGKGGAIINIASTSALILKYMPMVPIYSATKSAVLQFSVALGANDYYDRTRVRVLTMCFGITETALINLKNMGSFDEVIKSRLEKVFSIQQGQKPQSAARAVIDAYKLGASGTVWMSDADKPVINITDNHTKAYGILSEPVFNN